jgi:hypothetical protein
MSKMGFGGMGQMFEGMEAVKRAWSAFNVPTNLVPTLDVEELDKRIADLKAVEQWLNLNVTMLRGTIQGMEIQRGTLAAVKAFGASFGVPAGVAATTARKPTRSAEPPRAEPVRTARERSGSATADTKANDKAAAAAPTSVAGMDASAWWNMLQNNFNQVAQAAMSGSGLPGTAFGAPPKTSKDKPKPRTRS